MRLTWLRYRMDRRALRRFSGKVGLELTAGRARETILRGRREGVEVQVAFERNSGNEPCLSISARCDPPVPEDMVLLFDLHHGVVVEGDEGLVLTILESSFRDLVSRHGSVALAKRTVRIELYGAFEERVLSGLLDRAVATAKRCGRIADGVPAVLLDSVFSGAPIDIRERSARLLFIWHRITPEAEQAIDRGLADPEPRIRLIAAAYAGERGHAVVEELIFADLVSDDLRRLALARAMGSFDGARSDKLLSAIIEAPFLGMLHSTAVAWLLEKRPDTATELLIPLSGKTAGPGARAVARALARFPGPEVEACLIRLLDERDEETASEAAGALAQVGTGTALPALRAAIDRRFASTELRDMARFAVRAIRARMPGVTGGQLALADDREETGRLSVTDAGGGALSPINERNSDMAGGLKSPEGD